LYSCLDAFVVDASDYSGSLIRHLLNASEAFPTEWFLLLSLSGRKEAAVDDIILELE
jgi:hypothetical protein